MAKTFTFDEVLRKIIEGVDDSVQPKRLRAVARFAQKIIVDRTRAGKGVGSFKQEQPERLLPLSPEYIEFRRKSKKLDRSTTSPRKSNLTFTGELLRSIKATVSRAGTARIEPSRKRNKAVAGYVADGGRPFMYLSISEQGELRKFYDKTFDTLLKNKGLK